MASRDCVGTVSFGSFAVRTITLSISLRVRRSVAMTATNVAEEANREVGRVRNQPVRPPPIDVDTTLAMDDVPEDDKFLRWYSITIGMPGASMPAMWFDIISGWLTDTPAGALRVIRIQTALTYCAASAQFSRVSASSRSATTRRVSRARATVVARPDAAADPARAAPATGTVRPLIVIS